MSILDNYLVFSDNVAVTGSAISDVIDRGADPVLANFGQVDGDLFLVVQTGTAFTGTTPGLTVTLESDSTADLATSPTVHSGTKAFAAADLTANTVLAVLPVPPGDYERYIGLRYATSGTVSTGSVKSFITRDPNYWRAMTANNPPAV